ncbi:MAG TPA: hypothetical protein VFG00_09025 [Acidothermaceae bacterium]|nr:hypothetical protein [Acidothermaceae bacterium]
MSFWPFNARPLGVQTALSVGASAVALTVPAGSLFAVISIETQAIRWRDDGVDPTATTGILVPVTSSSPWVYGSTYGLSKISFIAVTGSATLNVSFYG